MSLSVYEASVPVYIRMLDNLTACLAKARTHAEAQGADLAALSEARLAPDMHPLNRQIHMASDAAKGGAARLSGGEAPSFPDVETTFDDLQARIDKTVAYLKTIKPESMDGAETRTIELKTPNATMTFSGRDFLLFFSLPNFLFHVTTAYDILRQQGAPIGKMDFLAGGASAGQTQAA